MPASAIISASPIFWQVMPWAPAAICSLASSGLLCVLMWGRLATPAAAHCAWMRAMLRSTLSMSMTAHGVPYSLAILAASGVVISFTPCCRHCEERNDEAIQSRIYSCGLLPPSPFGLWRTSRFARNDEENVGWAKRRVPTVFCCARPRWARRWRALAHPTAPSPALDLLAQHFELQPAVFGSGELGLRGGERSEERRV